MRYLATILLISTALIGCSDTVTTRYADIQQARAEQAFDRGWLPPVLPQSTKNITEKNNLDLSVGEGSFTFSPEDLDSFFQKGAKATQFTPSRRSPQKSFQDEGYIFLTFSNHSTSWLIAVHPDGRGAYWVQAK